MPSTNSSIYVYDRGDSLFVGDVFGKLPFKNNSLASLLLFLNEFGLIEKLILGYDSFRRNYETLIYKLELDELNKIQYVSLVPKETIMKLVVLM